MSFLKKLSIIGDGVQEAVNSAANLVAASSAGKKVASAASAATDSVADAWNEHAPTRDEIASAASAATDSVTEAWDKHAPSKEAVVGTFVVGGFGVLALTKTELEVVGARTISAASKSASTVSDAATAAATVAKENPGAAVAGAVIGVAAVAAAPFTGGGSLLGAATLASSLAGAGGIAVATAAVGASASVAISNVQTKKIQGNAHNLGIAKGKAESAVKIEELSKMMVHAAEAYSAQARQNEFIISLAAIGLSMAACDGSVSSEERACVKEYVIGVSKFVLPQNIRDLLNKIVENPPLFEDATVYVKKLDRNIWPCIDGLLEVISEADGDTNTSEQEFLTKWEKYKIVALEKGAIA